MRLFSSLFFLLLLTACGEDATTDTTAAAENKASAPLADQTSAPAPGITADAPSESLCFYREVAAPDGSGLKDREILKLTIMGKRVSGRYEYLPAEKDARRGMISGTYNGNTVRADYAFEQDGSEGVLTFDIIISGGMAVFRGVPARFGMPDKLNQVDCDDLAGQ